MTKTAVVVGAGLGGLATALRLVHRGWKVVVLEQGAGPGGKLNRYEQDGFTFDTGPSLITLPHVFDRLFAIGGVDFRERLNPVRLDPLFEYRFSDQSRLTYSSELPDLTAEIERLTGSTEDIDGLYRFLELGAKLYNLSERTFFDRPPLARPRFKDLSLLLSAPKRHAWGNYKKSVHHHFKDLRMRQVFERYPTYVGATPEKSVGTLALIPYMELAFGGWYIPGGLYRIVRELRNLVIQAGVRIKYNAAVSDISTENGSAVGVETSTGDSVKADIVVSNADPGSMHRITNGKAGRELKPDQRSMSGLVMLIGLNKKLKNIRHHTVCFSDDYNREFSQIFNERRFPDDPTVYVNIPSVTDPTMAPADGESVFVMANAPADPSAWTPEFQAEAVRRVKARLTASGMPDLFANAQFVEYWTPARLESDYSAPGGSIYGQVSHGWRGTFIRPSLKDRKINNLYYVGGGTHPGGGTPTVLMSAEIVSDVIGNR
jgi:phytoene desaturase